MTQHYEHLGIFSDLVAEARRQGPLYPVAAPGPATQASVREVLGFCRGLEMPLDVRVERCWERDDLAGEELSWFVGYGPRTHAYLLKPAHAREPLSALVALHDHGGFEYYGKEKIADGPDAAPAVLVAYREQYYGGRAYANALASEGFVVLVHDTFLMSTYEGLLDHNMSHTWMLFPFGWARHGDWPDLAACRAPSPLLVQYALADDLFTEPGMRAADARLRDHFAGVGCAEAYTGQFYPGPHRFGLEMQAAAFAWLHERR
jgi:hypothetical protein